MKIGVWDLAAAMLAAGKIKREIKKMEISKQLGPVVLDLAMKDGALVGEVKLPLMDLIDMAAAKIKGAIPGSIDDAVIDVIVAAIKTELAK